ncbi:MAG: YceI family protein [Actinomycetota bacterium]
MSDAFPLPPTPSHRPTNLNGSVILSKDWARQLGVQRTSGYYRIGRSELRRLIAASPDQAILPELWDIDPAHSNVSFIARHLMLAKVRGAFREFGGTIRLGGDLGGTKVEVSVRAESIDTGLALRDAHLRSPDFLDARRHPYLRFESTGLERAESGTYKLSGNLTIKAVTRPIVLDLDFLGTARDPAGVVKAAFEARTEIDRQDFGLTWNKALDAGGFLVDNMVTLEIAAQAVPRQPAA